MTSSPITALVFPHQLHLKSPVYEKAEQLIFIEERLFFTQFRFHKQKLMLHRASMKSFQQAMEAQGKTCIYIEFHEHSEIGTVLSRWKNQSLHYHETDDYLLEKRITKAAESLQISITRHESGLFINPLSDTLDLLKKQRKPFMAAFYTEQRKKHGILLEKDGSPQGGKWSFDTENRKRIPAGHPIPERRVIPWTEEVKEAASYVEQWFPENPGESKDFNWPVNAAQSAMAMEDFFREQFSEFGPYEDAMKQGEAFLFHSVLSPLINIGLITPRELIARALLALEKGEAPLAGVEGFIRQILGWREFMRGMYHLQGVKMRNSNHFRHMHELEEGFYTGLTGIPPIDDSVKKVLKHSYTHHIERLMILGNYMVLAEIHPHAAYRWFMEMFIDAYDWVMVPNVYGMSLYADGGGMTTKPYVSGSNYLLKMSDFGKGPWCAHWDALYWNFIQKHRDSFAKNPRMSMMLSMYNKIDSGRKKAISEQSEKIISTQTPYIPDKSLELSK